MKRETRLRPARGGALFGAVSGLTPLPITTPAPPLCFLCKRTVCNERRFAVCAECDDAHEIRAAWAIDHGDERAHGHAASDRECFCPGWLWMNEDDDASFNIERCDTCALFGDDADAAKAMVERCNIRGVEWSA